MMSSYICRQCRTRLLQRTGNPRSPQWQPRASFISLRQEQTQQPPSSTQEAEATKSPVRRTENPAHNFRIQPKEKQTGVGHNESVRPRGRYSRYAQDLAQASRRNVYNSPEVVTDTEAAHPSYKRDDSDTKTVALLAGSDNPIIKLLTDGRLEDAWTKFQETFPSRQCAALENPSFRDIDLVRGGKLFDALLRSTRQTFCKKSGAGPSPTEVLFKFEQLGVSCTEHWNTTIVDLTHELLRLQEAVAAQKRNQDCERVLAELLSVWRLFFQCKGTLDDPLEAIDLNWTSISNTKLQLQDAFLESDMFARMQRCHPKLIGSIPLSFSAILTFTLLNERIPGMFEISPELRKQSAPFFQLLAHFLFRSRIDSVFSYTKNNRFYQALSQETRRRVEEQIKEAPFEAMAIVGSTTTDSEARQGSSQASALDEWMIKRIGRAVTSKSHVGVVDSLWRQSIKVYMTNGKTSIPPSVYNSFITGYLALYQADKSVEVWNHMMANGVKPDVKTWTAMLTGCEKARDLEGLNATWMRMIRTGIQPDIHAWTTRIYGLITLRQIQAGLLALDEMGKNWLAAESVVKDPRGRGDGGKGGKGKQSVLNKPQPVNDKVKPSIEVINGAITALANLSPNFRRHNQKLDEINKVLRWASTFALKADARTYNTLVKLYLAEKDYGTAMKLIKQMEQEGIEPDVATYTMLIRAAFDNDLFSAMSYAEQANKIIALLTSLEEGGLKLNTYVYSSIIDRLLKQHSNSDAVKAVTEHMLSRDIMVSPQIYTSLMTHYFQQNPPDIAAADNLWARIMAERGTPTDKILFDRVIEGYAAANEVGKMMAVLARMSTHGKLPGWAALTAVVEALGRAQDWERAKMVIRDVQMGAGVAQGGVTGGVQRMREFWKVVAGLGLLPPKMDPTVRALQEAMPELVEQTNEAEGEKEAERNELDEEATLAERDGDVRRVGAGFL